MSEDPEINKEELTEAARNFIEEKMTPAQMRKAKSDQLVVIAGNVPGTPKYIERRNRKAGTTPLAQDKPAGEKEQ